MPFLSVIIPAYNEEHRLPATIGKISAYLEAQPYSYELIIVENGSEDRTFQIAQEFAEGNPNLRVLRESERGKGLAVKLGMLEACGEYRFMCDADLSMPVTEIGRFLPPALTEFDIAIASREGPGAIRYDEPAYRHFVGRVFNTMIRLIALPRLHDTQCGFKCFHYTVAEDLFRCQTLAGWSFDVELLFIAEQRGYRIVELPIPWFFNPDSKVNVLQDSFQMAMDLLRIRLNGLRGEYVPAL
jgi:dolichyl-phosphate beta-glucosyltransferase